MEPFVDFFWNAWTTADIVKPMQGLGSGVFEIALAFKGEAFRVVYAVQLGEDIWPCCPRPRS